MTTRKPSEVTNELMARLRAEMLALAPDDPGWGPKTTEYVRLVSQYQKERTSENSAAIGGAQGRIAQAVFQAVARSGIEELIGQPVLRLLYTFTPAEGDKPAVVGTIVNPAKVGRTPKAKAEGDGSGTGNGERRNLDAIFTDKANDEDKAKMALILQGFTSKGADQVDATSPEGKRVVNSRKWALQNQVANRE